MLGVMVNNPPNPVPGKDWRTLIPQRLHGLHHENPTYFDYNYVSIKYLPDNPTSIMMYTPYITNIGLWTGKGAHGYMIDKASWMMNLQCTVEIHAESADNIADVGVGRVGRERVRPGTYDIGDIKGKIQQNISDVNYQDMLLYLYWHGDLTMYDRQRFHHFSTHSPAHIGKYAPYPYEYIYKDGKFAWLKFNAINPWEWVLRAPMIKRFTFLSAGREGTFNEFNRNHRHSMLGLSINTIHNGFTIIWDDYNVRNKQWVNPFGYDIYRASEMGQYSEPGQLEYKRYQQYQVAKVGNEYLPVIRLMKEHVRNKDRYDDKTDIDELVRLDHQIGIEKVYLSHYNICPIKGHFFIDNDGHYSSANQYREIRNFGPSNTYVNARSITALGDSRQIDSGMSSLRETNLHHWVTMDNQTLEDEFHTADFHYGVSDTYMLVDKSSKNIELLKSCNLYSYIYPGDMFRVKVNQVGSEKNAKLCNTMDLPRYMQTFRGKIESVVNGWGQPYGTVLIPHMSRYATIFPVVQFSGPLKNYERFNFDIVRTESIPPNARYKDELILDHVPNYIPTFHELTVGSVNLERRKLSNYRYGFVDESGTAMISGISFKHYDTMYDPHVGIAFSTNNANCGGIHSTSMLDLPVLAARTSSDDYFVYKQNDINPNVNYFKTKSSQHIHRDSVVPVIGEITLRTRGDCYTQMPDLIAPYKFDKNMHYQIDNETGCPLRYRFDIPNNYFEYFTAHYYRCREVPWFWGLTMTDSDPARVDMSYLEELDSLTCGYNERVLLREIRKTICNNDFVFPKDTRVLPESIVPRQLIGDISLKTHDLTKPEPALGYMNWFNRIGGWDIDVISPFFKLPKPMTEQQLTYLNKGIIIPINDGKIQDGVVVGEVLYGQPIRRTKLREETKIAVQQDAVAIRKCENYLGYSFVWWLIKPGTRLSHYTNPTDNTINFWIVPKTIEQDTGPQKMFHRWRKLLEREEVRLKRYMYPLRQSINDTLINHTTQLTRLWMHPLHLEVTDLFTTNVDVVSWDSVSPNHPQGIPGMKCPLRVSSSTSLNPADNRSYYLHIKLQKRSDDPNYSDFIYFYSSRLCNVSRINRNTGYDYLAIDFYREASTDVLGYSKNPWNMEPNVLGNTTRLCHEYQPTDTYPRKFHIFENIVDDGLLPARTEAYYPYEKYLPQGATYVSATKRYMLNNKPVSYAGNYTGS